GATFGHVLVLFPAKPGDAATTVTTVAYEAPATTTRHLIAGLEPGGGYEVTRTSGADGIRVTISLGGNLVATQGGVLDLFGDEPSTARRRTVRRP
ncbi:MAG: hypothetical protein R3338_13260, partial [Thermoanaerobaculia bacterium]|nr:hypothetical protein [Thermoanaerobaculia bacterium]